MARAVAFFRNLNLGQGWAPTRPQLVQAFESVGATGVDSVQVNGTVIFTAPRTVRTAVAVRRILLDLTGFDDVVVVRSASFVRELARRLSAEVDAGAHVEASFFDARSPVPVGWTSPDGRLEILWGDARHAVTEFRTDGRGGSNASAALRELTGARVTSRGASTIIRVASRLA